MARGEAREPRGGGNRDRNNSGGDEAEFVEKLVSINRVAKVVKGGRRFGFVVMRAAPAGTGIIAGGPMRAVFEALGVQDVVAKSIGTSNPHNMVKATLAALASIVSPRVVAARRGKKIADILGKPEAGASEHEGAA
jgi:ribosomal protein S5